MSASTRVLVPVGMLGGGFPAEPVSRGLERGIHTIAVDAGSTDSGPYYLGTATPKTATGAVLRDLRILLNASQRKGIPLIVGSCGTSGTDTGVDWVADMVSRIAVEDGLTPRVARLYSEQSIDGIVAALAAGKIAALEPATALDEATVRRCSHIVGLMGHHPIANALDQGADVILAGRASDTAVIAALPLLRGCAPGPAWHAAKTVECGAQCTTDPRSGGVLVEIDDHGFTVEPLDAGAACTPQTVAAHMLYENADPFRMREPSGTLVTTDAVYTPLDERRVRVEGSTFVPGPLTMKLEGAALAGYQTIAISGIRDPAILASIDQWRATLTAFLDDRIPRVLGLRRDQYRLEVRCYGHDAILGELEPDKTPPHEVGVVLIITASDQQTAHEIAKFANPYLLHMPVPGASELPSYAFLFSPAELNRGPIYEFVLQHAVALESPDDRARTEFEL